MRSKFEKKYTDRDLDLIEKLKEKFSYTQIGTIFGRSKNSVLGAAYRRKLKRGHQVVKDAKPTYCLVCGDRTGYGFGKEPTRHDIHWCNTPCWKNFFGEK